MNGRNEFEVTTSTSRKPTSGPVARRAGVAGELSAVAGTTQRRGSVLVLVIGVLALLAIIVVVYTAIGQSDARTGRAIVTKTQNDDASRSVGNYIAQIIGDNATATYFTRPEATRQFMTVLQATDYPSTDPEARSVFRAGITQDRFRAVKFSPSGHQRHRWDDTAGNDPRVSSDPWLASTEPTWINRTPASTSDTPASIPDLVMNMTDWAQMSIISPDGRVVNLANLRASLQAPSGFGTVGGLSAISEQLRQIRPPTTVAQRTSALQLDSSLASTTDEYNSPVTWAIGPGLFRHVKDTGAIGPTGASPGSPDYLGNQFADADGDGFYDSRWQELVDASNPDEPVNILGSSGSLRLFVAPRIIDLSGLVNVNTATSFADPFSSRGQVPPGTTRGTVAIDPILPQASVLLGNVGADLETAFRGAPVRYRMTSVSQPGFPPIRPSLTSLNQLQSRRYFIEAAPGATPADVDLERLLTGFDAARYLGRSPEDYFGALRPNDPYGQLLAGPNPQELRAELGGAGFASLMTMRSLGVANSTDFAISGSLPTGIDNVTATGGALYPYFIPGALPFSPAHAERGIEDVISGVAIPPANLQPGLQRELFDERVVREAYRLYVTPEDRKAFYARATAGSNTFNQVTSSTTGPLGNSTDVDFSVAGLAGLSDERELRTFGGANDPRTQSSLETSVDFRLAQTAASPVGPMRSNRSLLDDRDRDVETAAGREARLAQYFTDPRRLMTTISGGRPLMATSERFVEPSGAANNATLASGATLTERNVRLDAVSAISRALPMLQTNSAGVETVVSAGSASAANEIFINYAEALIPLADSQHALQAAGGLNGFDLWSPRITADDRRTSATIFGALYTDTSASPSVVGRREAPRQNTELALRAAAHMTLNLLAWRDPSNRPIAATLLLNHNLRPGQNNGIADLAGSNNGDALKLTSLGGEVVAYPYWSSSSAAASGADQWTFGLNFDDPNVRRDTSDLDRDGNRNEAMIRLYDPSVTSGTPAQTPAAVNIFAVRPEPVITHVQSYVVYTDAVRPGEEGKPTAPYADFVELQTALDSTGDEFEYAEGATVAGTPVPAGDPRLLGKIKINGVVDRNNPDFLFEMVAFQISNPSDSPIYLSGFKSNGEPIKPPVYDVAGVPGFRSASNGTLAVEPDGFLEPFGPGDQNESPAIAAGSEDEISNDNRGAYYIEFGGRFYRLADYSFGVAGGNSSPDDLSLRGRGVVLEPGQSRTFYVLGQNPARIATRLNDSGRATGFTAFDVVEWVHTQLWQRYSYRRPRASVPGNEVPEVIARIGDGKEYQPIRVLPFNPVTGERLNPGPTGEDLGLGVVYPQRPGLSAGGGQLIGVQADNTTVRLWRTVRQNVPGSGLTDEVGTSPTNLPDNKLGNDVLVDRLTDPIVGPAMATNPRLASVERRLGMGLPSTDDVKRMGEGRQKIEGSTGGPSGTQNDTGLSIVMTGGFRRPDDVSGWVNLETTAPANERDYRGIGGGPTPDPVFGTSFPRGVLPAWAIEAGVRVPAAGASLYAESSLYALADVGGSSIDSRYWLVGAPQTQSDRSRNTNAFLLGHPRLRGKVGTGGEQILNLQYFTTGAFFARSEAQRRLRPFYTGITLVGTTGIFGPRFTSTQPSSQEWRSDSGPMPLVPEIAAHPSDKFRQAEIVRRNIRAAVLPTDIDYGDPDLDQITLIDLSNVNSDFSGAGQQPELIGVTGNERVELRAAGTNFSRKHTIVPQFPRSIASKNANERSETAILPELRPADMLLPLAIGPSQAPREQASDPRTRWLAYEWETFSEAAGAAFGYGAREQYVVNDPSKGWKVGLGDILDNGRLPLYTPAPFNDPTGSLNVPSVVGVDRSNFIPTFDRGIPLAMAVLDRFRTLPQGGLNTPTIGTVNVNTAPLTTLRMLPMMTSMDVNRDTNRLSALHSWMTHGLTLSALRATTTPAWETTASLNQVQQQNGPMNSAGARRLDPPDVPNPPAPVLDARSFLRNRGDSVWDLAASVAAYRDKNAVHTMPSLDDQQRFVIDFAEGNDRSIPAAGNRFDDFARGYLTEIPGLREQPGFGSIGELLAVRVVDTAADARRFESNGSVAASKNLRTENNLRGAPDPQRIVTGVDLTIAGQISMDRFGRDNQPADYAFQRRAEGSSGFEKTETDPQIPLALTPLFSPQALSSKYTNPLDPDFTVVRPIDRLRNGTAVPGTVAPIDIATMANLRPSSAVDSYEQKLIIANSLLNTVSVRSDIFCAYFVLHGYQQADLDGISAVAGDPGYDQPMVPTLKRRYMMVVDRSNVVKPGDKPKILMFQELPTE